MDNRPRCQNCGKVIAQYREGTLVQVHRCDKNTKCVNVFSDKALTVLGKSAIKIAGSGSATIDFSQKL